MSFLAFAVRTLLALGLVAAVLVYRRRIGGVGPYVLLGVPIVDVMIGAAYRLSSLLAPAAIHSGAKVTAVGSAYSVLGVFSILGLLVATALAVAAFTLMRRAP